MKGAKVLRLSFEEICEKEVINLTDGTCFGYAGDVFIDTETRTVTAIAVKGSRRFFGIFGREEDILIPWEEIETIGKDAVLVKTSQKRKKLEQKENIFQKFLNIFLY